MRASLPVTSEPHAHRDMMIVSQFIFRGVVPMGQEGRNWRAAFPLRHDANEEDEDDDSEGGYTWN
ncbi:MAG: hypothetical protein KAY24_11295 [Candidatus Eisenbacteria sp.]|nr:hypothetical protein [Candidatus Eisenbacteria bacterium]